MKTLLSLAVAGTVLLAALGAAARADVVYLKNGKKFEGVAEDKGGSVVLRLERGSFTFAKDDVDRVESKPAPWVVYEEKAAKLKPEDAAGHLELAKWCRDNGLASRMEKEYQAALAADPENAEVHALLGHEKLGGKWLTRDEAMKAKGFTQVEGAWLGPKEYEAYQQRKALEERVKAEAQAKLGRFEALADKDKDKDKAAEARKFFKDQGEKALQDLSWAALSMKSAAVRLEAVKLINEIGVPDKSIVSGWLARAAWQDTDNDVLVEIARGIRARKDETALTLLVCTAASENAYRRRAAYALKLVGDVRAYRALIGCLVGASTNTLPGQMGMNLQQFNDKLTKSGAAEGTGIIGGEVLPAADSLEYISGKEYKNDVRKWLKWVEDQEKAPGGGVIDPGKGN